MSDAQITCTPRAGILTVSADTIAALDLLAVTLSEQQGWQVQVRLKDDITLTASPATTSSPA